MTSPLQRFHPFIPAGGVGSRLWPLSRADAPKFLLDLTGSGSSLLRATYDRLAGLSAGPVMVVTGRSHAGAVQEQLPELTGDDLVLEPSPKDSAAAIGLACTLIARRDPEAIIGRRASISAWGRRSTVSRKRMRAHAACACRTERSFPPTW